MKGLLLAGGYGTRLRPLTFTGNKHTIPIANKPIILYGLEHLVESGVREIGIVLGPLREGIVEIVNSQKIDAEITFIEQRKPKGLAHAIALSKKFIGGDTMVVYLGDNMLKEGAKPLIRVFEDQGSDCVIGVSEVKDPNRFGVVVFDQDGQIKRLVEKPKEMISNWALIGVYVFNSKIFDAISRINPSWRNELEITDAIQLLIDDKAKVNHHKVQGWWKDTGRPEDLLEANQLVLEGLTSDLQGRVEAGAQITGRVSIGKNAKISQGTKIRGPAIIGQNCVLGPNTYIGPYTSIGDNVRIRNSEVENTIVMDRVIIDCGKKIVDSLIGREVHIVSSDHHLPSGNRLIVGDMSYVSI